MDDYDHTFKTYVYSALDALLKVTAKAGDSIRVASNNTIEKLDAFQLEKKLGQLYSRLGKLTFSALLEGNGVTGQDEQATSLCAEITSVIEELARRSRQKK